MITNDRAWFHLCCKETILKYQKVSKYYENDYSWGKLMADSNSKTSKMMERKPNENESKI